MPPYCVILKCILPPDKALRETLDRVMSSGYFDRAHAHHNGVCEELQPDEPPVAELEAEVPPAEPGNTGLGLGRVLPTCGS